MGNCPTYPPPPLLRGPPDADTALGSGNNIHKTCVLQHTGTSQKTLGWGSLRLSILAALFAGCEACLKFHCAHQLSSWAQQWVPASHSLDIRYFVAVKPPLVHHCTESDSTAIHACWTCLVLKCCLHQLEIEWSLSSGSPGSSSATLLTFGDLWKDPYHT